MQVLTQSEYEIRDHDVIIGEQDTPYVLRIRDLPNNEKPREKLIQYGPKTLSTAELVAVLLGVGTKKEEVLAMAHRVLKEYGETAIIYETNPSKLAVSLDIPITKACQIIAGFELGRRYFQKRSGKSVFIRTSNQAYQYLKNMAYSNKEQLRGLYLNSHHQVIHDEVISVGSLTANIVHPREVFQPAIEHGAVAILLAHNHPSGNLKPSAADITVTGQLIAAGEVLGIEILDHLIIANNKFISIMEDHKK